MSHPQVLTLLSHHPAVSDATEREILRFQMAKTHWRKTSSQNISVVDSIKQIKKHIIDTLIYIRAFYGELLAENEAVLHCSVISVLFCSALRCSAYALSTPALLCRHINYFGEYFDKFKLDPEVGRSSIFFLTIVLTPLEKLNISRDS